MDLVTVAAYPTAAQAHLAKNLLESEGIRAYVVDDACGDLFHLSAQAAEAKVQVDEAEANAARRLIREAESHKLAKGTAHEAEEHSHDPRPE